MRGLNKDSINRILIRGVNWVGDSVLTIPAVELIKKIFPKADLGIMIKEELRPLWEDNPYIDEVIPFKKRTGIKAIGEIGLIRKLSKGNWDMAILFPNSFHSALIVFLAGVPIRIGYNRDKRGFLLTYKIDLNDDTLKKHQVEYYLDLVKNLGDDKALSNLPRINIDEKRLKWAEDFLFKNGVKKDDVLVGVNPGAAYGAAKRWFPERYAELIEKLLALERVKIIIVGAREERYFFNYLKKEVKGNVIDTVSKTDLVETAALLSKCHILVTNDSGPMHIGAAVNTPVIAVFGSTDSSLTGPLGKNHLIIKKDVSCSPCFERDCDTLECFHAITVEEVYHYVKDQINKIYGLSL